jgi:hypothetical protein
MLRLEDSSAPIKLRHRISISLFVLAIFLPTLIHSAQAAELKKETVEAWNRYLQWVQARVDHELTDPNIFLFQNSLPQDERAALWKRLNAGEIIVDSVPSAVPRGVLFEVPSGEIHHWWGTILLRNVSLDHLLQFLQDYAHHAGKFADVERSRLISRDGNRYRFFFRLRRSKAFVTASYNTEQECLYTNRGPHRVSSQSSATKIAELENPGTNSEREKPPGNDRGFLWRLVSWWRFEQRGADVVIELESASLSREIPAFIKFLPGISNYINSTPRESLESVLISIRQYMSKSTMNQ